MELTFFQSLLFGAVSGLTDILPVSAQTHKAVLLTLFGAEREAPLLRLLIHLAVLGALYLCGRSQIQRISRNLKLAAVPKRRRKRPLDTKVLMEWRLLKTIAVPAVICWLFSRQTASLEYSLSWIALFSLVNAMILFLPSLLPTGNKDSRSLSPMEGILMGLGAGAGIFPGISSLGVMLSAASVCGVEASFGLTVSLLVQMAVTAVQIVFDVVALFAGVGAVSFVGVLGYLAAAAAAFGCVHLGVRLMRVLSVRKGYHVFAFYSLAAAFLCFIFYLIV